MAPPAREVSSGCQPPMVKACVTRRVPGLSFISVGRSFRFSVGSRYMVMTSALEKSDSKMSAFSKRARSATPAACARRVAWATMSGLYSMPWPRAPNSLAAAMTILPSPAPRSIT